MLRYDFYTGWYSPSNGTIANAVLRDRDLNLQWWFWEVKAEKIQTLLLPSDRISGICHGMVLLWIWNIMTSTYICKFTNFEMWISRKGWELAKTAQIWLLYSSVFAIESDHCQYCTPWPWPSFLRSKIFLLNISYKKMRRQRSARGRFASIRTSPSVWSCSCFHMKTDEWIRWNVRCAKLLSRCRFMVRKYTFEFQNWSGKSRRAFYIKETTNSDGFHRTSGKIRFPANGQPERT